MIKQPLAKLKVDDILLAASQIPVIISLLHNQQFLLKPLQVSNFSRPTRCFRAQRKHYIPLSNSYANTDN